MFWWWLLLNVMTVITAMVFPPEESREETPHACQWRHNLTDSSALSLTQLDTLENCLYYYLAQTQPSHFELINDPPWEFPLIITVEEAVVHQVDLMQKTASQFNIHGDMLISWKDTRLEWNETEWKMKEFALHDNHHIWTPHFNDDSSCSAADGCISKIQDIEIDNEGKVSARFTFRYPAFCGVDYYRYPEETNDCCLMMSITEMERRVKYEIKTKERVSVQRQVAITAAETSGDTKVFKNVETSVWTDRTLNVVSIKGYRAEFLRLCVHAKKEMSTLRIALRVPVTIATLLMLVSPLFGDLRTQSLVKLFTLTLQTICFLFMCSIAPENGFAGNKPKLYTFYEFLFFVSFLSILVTLICLALCRVRRSVPPSHFAFLTAKMVNRFFCCIEPESSSYERHLEDGGFDSARDQEATRASASPDYTHEWRHIYIAVNNLFSAISFDKNLMEMDSEKNDQRLYTGWRIKCSNKSVYTIDSSLGKNVYIVNLKGSNSRYCLKVEWEGGNIRSLRRDVSVLLSAERYSKKKFDQFFGLIEKGRINGKFRWMITELGGYNLDDYRLNYLEGADFEKFDAINLSIQTFLAIYDLHLLGYVHRNIRPSKFVLAQNNAKAVFMVGFSMAHPFHQSSCRLSASSFLKSTFLPRSVHKGKKYTRSDDLESWVYVCMDLFGRKLLPWNQKMGNMNMFVKKEEFFCGGFPHLFNYFPSQFQIILKNLDKTGSKKPDYALIATLMNDVKEKYDQIHDEFNWQRQREPQKEEESETKTKTPILSNSEVLLEITAKSEEELEEITAISNNSSIKQSV